MLNQVWVSPNKEATSSQELALGPVFWSIRELEVSDGVVFLRSFIHKALWSLWVCAVRPVAMAVVEFLYLLLRTFIHLSCRKAVILVQLLVWKVILWGYTDRHTLQRESLSFENTLVLLGLFTFTASFGSAAAQTVNLMPSLLCSSGSTALLWRYETDQM